jgi:hypothetical protein
MPSPIFFVRSKNLTPGLFPAHSNDEAVLVREGVTEIRYVIVGTHCMRPLSDARSAFLHVNGHSK